MDQISLTLDNLDELFEGNLDPAQIAAAKTLFLKRLAEQAHRFYCGKMQTLPKAGAFIVATGRGDFPNQVNNSVDFPGILKGALLVKAKKISDGMTIAAARALTNFAEDRGITPENIIATMEEPGVFPHEASEVAVQAVKEGLARVDLSPNEVFRRAEEDIKYSRDLTLMMQKMDFIKEPPQQMLQEAFEWAIREVK